MNLNDNPTMDRLRDLLRPLDDRAAHHVLWVDHSGEVHITKVEKKWPVPPPPQDVLNKAIVRFETFEAGNGYVGPLAASDDEWVTDAFEWLAGDWSTAQVKGTPVMIRV